MINFIKAKLHVNNEIDGGKILPLNHKLGFFSVLGFKKNSGYFSGRIYFERNDTIFYPGYDYNVKIIFLLEDEFFKEIDYSSELFVSIKPTIIFGKITISDDEIQKIKNKTYNIYEIFYEKKFQLDSSNFSVLPFEKCFYIETFSNRCKNCKKFDIKGQLFVVAKKNNNNDYLAIEILENKVERFILIHNLVKDGKYSIFEVYDTFEEFIAENIKEFKCT